MVKDKVVVITGSSSGIGWHIAKLAAEQGARLGLLDRGIGKSLELQESVNNKGGRCLAVECDITDRKMVFESIQKFRETLGEIDILINNAGVSNFTLMSNVRIDDWIQTVDVNVCGVLHCTAACLQDMIDKKKGHIINITSVAAHMSGPKFPVYSGTKHFIHGYSKAIRKELAPLGIKVTTVAPGLTLTNIHTTNSDTKAQNVIPEGFGVNSLLRPQSVANAVLLTLTQEDNVALNDILVEPSDMPMV